MTYAPRRLAPRVPLGWIAALWITGCTGASVVGGPDDRPAPSDLADVQGLDDLADAGPVDTGPMDTGTLDAADAADVPVDVAADTPDVPMGCTSDMACAGNPSGPVCDVSTGRCVRCLPSADACPVGQRCDPMMFVCVNGCRNDEGCAINATPDAGSVGGDAGVPLVVCDTQTNRCVACLTDTQCPSGTLCRGQQCVAGCSTDRPCPGTDTCCNGACVDTQSNTAACGSCTTTCTPANAAPSCVAGQCGVASCAGTFGDCDGNAANGCETELSSSTTHCGTCGRACSFANAAGACTMGACTITRCNDGFADCDGSPANGCETNLGDSAAHCGACGTSCARTNADGVCQAGVCSLGTCRAGFGDCDMNAANGCEAALDTLTHCGACGRSCASANATEACTNGACTIARCDEGFADCDMDPTNGCEADLRTGVGSCGRCGNTCQPANAVAACVAGACAITRCNEGFSDCDMDPTNGCEVDLRTSALNCGACGLVCTVPNAGAICTAGRCQRSSCNQNFADCDGDPSNGCEVDLRTNTSHCGRCDNRCNFPGSSASCTAGTCRLTMCLTGRGDCDNNSGNGCETDTLTSVVHCGACGTNCVTPNATPACTAGACAVGMCTAGFADCNNRVVDGCEVSTRTDIANCGACGQRCNLANASPACSTSVCTVAACLGTFGDCDGTDSNGCETNLQTSTAHCGTCGRVCSFANGVAGCTAGACTLASCNAGFADCDMNPANGCETDLNTALGSCGACGRSCSFANATAVCRSGTCALGACNAGFADCDNNPANGCETNTGNDVNNCGACGRACSTNACTTGVCDRGGDGADGVLTVTGTTPVTPAATPLAESVAQGGTVLRVVNTAGFTVGSEALVIDTQGVGAGQHAYARVTAVTPNTLTVTPGMPFAFASTDRVQVVRVLHYSALTVNAAATLRGPSWNGSTGGILPIRVSGTAAVAGTISQSGSGFRGGAGDSGGRTCGPGLQGESPVGPGARSTAANGGGGGGGAGGVNCCQACVNQTPSGGGAGFSVAGVNGTGTNVGIGGLTYGDANLSRIYLGSAGGGGGGNCDVASATGGHGGGTVLLSATTLTLASTGLVSADGLTGTGGGGYEGGGGGGSGGTILLAGRTVTAPMSRVSAVGIAGSVGCSQRGGAGGAGRVRIECATLNGTACPGAPGTVTSPAATVGSY